MAGFVLKNNYFEFNVQIKQVWFRYNYGIFFICTHGEQEFQTFLRSLIEFHADIKFT